MLRSMNIQSPIFFVRESFNLLCEKFTKMWMAYKTYPEVHDFKSGLRYLLSQFTDLEFDADHEAIYGFGRHLSVEDCYELSAKYRKAQQLCRKCLKGKINRIEFCKKLIGLNIGYINTIKPYLTESDLKAIDEVGEESAVFSEEEEEEDISD